MPLRRTIVVANSANPHGNSSVPIIGFKITKSIADLTDATLIFHDADRSAIERAYPSSQVYFAGSGVLFRGLRGISRRLFADRWNLIWLIEFFDYLIFDLHAFLIARRITRHERIDYVLRINPVSLRLPSVLAWLPVPVFTGPHNGGIEWPPGFAYMDAEEMTVTRLRFLGTILHALYRDFARYAGIFVASEHYAQAIPNRHRSKAISMSENGVDGAEECSPYAGDATRLLFVGRLVPYKGLRFVLRALARLPEAVSLTIAGDGVEREASEALAEQLGVADRCRFLGRIDHEQLRHIYASAGVFVFPSLRETGGAVVLEAMSHGLPCVIADWGGPALYTGNTGLRLAVESPTTLEDDLVETLTRLLGSPEGARKLGELARDRLTDEYVWARKGELLHAMILDQICSTTGPR